MRFKIPKVCRIKTKQVFNERFRFKIFTLQIKVNYFFNMLINNINEMFKCKKCKKNKKICKFEKFKYLNTII